MFRNRLFGSRAAKNVEPDAEAHAFDWVAPTENRVEVPPARRTVSKVNQETFESRLDDLDRAFAEGGAARPPTTDEPLPFLDERIVEPDELREMLAPTPPPPPVHRPVEVPRSRGRRDTILPWPVPPPENQPPAAHRQEPPLRPEPVSPPPPVEPVAPAPVAPPVSAAPPAPVAPAEAPLTPFRLDVATGGIATGGENAANAGAPVVAGLSSRKDLVNAFRKLLAAERAEAEAKAKLVPGQGSQIAEITLPKSVTPTTLRLKLEPRTDKDGRTVLSISVE